MKGDLFKGIAQVELKATDRKTKKAHRFKMPVFYRDNFCMNALYTASTDLVRKYLPDPLMYPLEVTRGRCLVSFTAFEYRDTDIAPYNEFSIAFLIKYGRKGLPLLSLMSQKRKRRFEMYIRHLPVTTEIARSGGVELYGFPKIIANIDFTRDRDVSRCVITEKKKQILTLQGPVIPVKPGDTTWYRCYPVYQGITIMAKTCFMNHQMGETRKTDDVKLILGDDHPICSELRSIELSEKAFMYQYIPSGESILFSPRNLIEG